ncbi:uncharacterized protein [Euwallacea fornicatus]|uniref:uncharacterized protein n=1 Tax=Euwallacea fornicatus TaxID=995702 RepID=UPI00338F7F91
MFTFICLQLRIKDSFVILNDYLDKMTKSSEASSVAHIEISDILLNCKPEKAALMRLQHFQAITNHHNNMCNILDKFNSISKAFLVTSMVCITSNLLFNFTAIMLYAVKRVVLGGFDALLLVMVTHTIFTITSVGQAAVTAFVGERLEDEGRRTSRICYTFLNKLNRKLKSENDHLIFKEVKFLLDQSKSRKISLHAGGFFKLNWGILGSITSTVATYSIVIIQFLLK